MDDIYRRVASHIQTLISMSSHKQRMRFHPTTIQMAVRSCDATHIITIIFEMSTNFIFPFKTRLFYCPRIFYNIIFLFIFLLLLSVISTKFSVCIAKVVLCFVQRCHFLLVTLKVATILIGYY